MSTYNIHFLDKIGKNPKISLNICFLKLSEKLPRNSKKEFELLIILIILMQSMSYASFIL